MSTRYQQFIALSAALTAHSVFELQGTGLAARYLDAVTEIAGGQAFHALLDAFARVTAGGGDADEQDERLRSEVLEDPYVGPVARNVIKLWYVGIWYRLPDAWREAYGARTLDETHTVTGTGYVEALLWPAIGASPPGAKAPGYGSWTTPPRIPTFR